MKQLRIALVGAAATLVLLAGCAKQDSESSDSPEAPATSEASDAGTDAPAAEPGAPAAEAGNVVKFGNVDAGPVTAVTCQIANGLVTINVEGSQRTTIELTDEDTPAVRSVSIGEAGAEGPSLMVLEGVSATPESARDGNRFTINGSGLGTETGGADAPVETPFEIAVTCP